MKFIIPDWLLITAAFGQMFTAIIYPYIRHVVFDWYNDVKKLKPLNQQIAKTYGHYIQGLNFSFGLITILCLEELKSQTGLAVALSGLIAAYWTGKLATQFAYYPMYEIPKKAIFRIGEVGMNTLFVLFAGTFCWLFGWNVYGFISN